MENTCCKSMSLGLALGIVWGLWILIMGLMAVASDVTIPVVRVMGSVYIGYQATVGGAIIGAIWAFVHGFIFGFLLSLLYRFFKNVHGTGCPMCKPKKSRKKR